MIFVRIRQSASEAAKLCAIHLRLRLRSGLQLGVRELSNSGYELSVQVWSLNYWAASNGDLGWSSQRDWGVRPELHAWRTQLGFWCSEPFRGWWSLKCQTRASGLQPINTLDFPFSMYLYFFNEWKYLDILTLIFLILLVMKCSYLRAVTPQIT
jgi:hypothetical protein